MGEITEMMLDGALCEGCGIGMGGSVGFPRLCHHCAQDRRKDGRAVEPNGLGGFVDCGVKPKRGPTPKKCKCPTCGKKVKESGLADHVRDVHGGAA